MTVAEVDVQPLEVATDPPCYWCFRPEPCDCDCVKNGEQACKCSCGRCLADYPSVADITEMNW